MMAGKKIRKYSRILHRDIGYLLVGLTLIYGISGIILNFKKRGVDPAYKETSFVKQIPAFLSIDEFEDHWNKSISDSPKLSRVYPKGEIYNFYIEGGMGSYNPQTGKLSYAVFVERNFVKFINEIHYNKGKRFTWLGTFFATAFIFLALTGLVIIKGKNGFRKRGVYFMLAGIILPVLWYFLT